MRSMRSGGSSEAEDPAADWHWKHSGEGPSRTLAGASKSGASAWRSARVRRGKRAKPSWLSAVDDALGRGTLGGGVEAGLGGTERLRLRRATICGLRECGPGGRDGEGGGRRSRRGHRGGGSRG